MFEQKQYDAWAVELANYFVSKQHYRMVRMSKDQREFWLVNPENKLTPIVMISALPTDHLDHNSIEHDRLALSSVFHVSKDGLNISVNQESVMSDQNTVIVGPGMISVSSILSSIKNIELVLKPSDNPDKTIASAFRNIQKSAVRAQQKFRRKNNPVTTVVSGIAIAIFLVGFLLQLQGFKEITVALMLGAFYKPLIVQGMEFFRFITAGFVHTDVFHLIINLMAFRNLGVMVEPVLGKMRYLIVLLAGIVFGNIFVFIVDGGVIGLGLSGGLFALLGALFVYLFETQAIRNPQIRNQVISTLVINLFISFLPGVSMMAHIGGLQVGVFLGIIFSKRKDWFEIRKIASFMLFVFTLFLSLLMIKNAYAEPNLSVLAEYIRSWQRIGFDAYVKRLLMIFFI